MGNSKLTLIGLYNYDDSILENLNGPTSFSSDDMETLKMNLLSEVGEFEVLYSDFDFFKAMIGFWSKKNKPVWDHLWETTQYQYNPIHNYDRSETRSITETRNLASSDSETRNLASSDTETRNLEWQDKRTADLTSGSTETHNLATSGSDTGTVETHSGSNESKSGTSNTTRSGRAFNDSDPVIKESESTSTSGTDAITGTNVETRNLASSGSDTGTLSISGTQGGTDTHDGTDKGTVGRSGTDTGTISKSGTDTGTIGTAEMVHIEGNIGVMSTQNMINQEREIALFNLMDHIINDFKHAFCIMKY